ncbi:hypothetical protein O1611_g1227 [Lasiodiplodia mahajangana]|uniref:Uncharacterized protein n=1 Tax=Lasiodiplodia mahajangana TaxID=1108764 RepID=A0ACC2JY01_9PEZI|nr:hypothetical protein O1611_g1227 [Lasiodiplodia mahajangana]
MVVILAAVSVAIKGQGQGQGGSASGSSTVKSESSPAPAPSPPPTTSSVGTLARTGLSINMKTLMTTSKLPLRTTEYGKSLEVLDWKIVDQFI